MSNNDLMEITIQLIDKITQAIDKEEASKKKRYKHSSFHPMLVDTRNAEFNEVPGVGHYRLDYEAMASQKKSAYI